jgi:hypothetical protein
VEDFWGMQFIVAMPSGLNILILRMVRRQRVRLLL